MKKAFIRLSCICLVIIMGLSVLASCNFGKDKGEESQQSTSDVIESENTSDVKDTEADVDTDKETEGDTDAETNGESEKETEKESETEKEEISEKDANLPERVTYEGADFTIATSLTDNNIPYISYVEADNLKSDAINKAFFERNNLLKSYSGVNVVVNRYKNTGNEDVVILNELEIATLGNTDFADVAYAIVCGGWYGMIFNGYIADMNEMSALNLDASYYDQRIQEEYNIEGKLFALEGDFTVQDEMRTMVVGINKTIYNDFHYNETYGSPYELVDDGKWTLDLMLQMAKTTGDSGTLNKDSQWGIISESQFPYTVYLGTGNKIIEVNDGSLYCTLADSASYQNTLEVIQNCVDKVLNSPDVSILIADKSPLINGFPEAQAMFANGQALFRTSTLYDFTKYQNMEDEFGILPVPKYSEDQPEYYSWCSSTSHCPLVVPQVAVDKHGEKTANLIEAMAYFSKYMPSNKQSLLDAFYKNMMDSKLCRDVKDRQMLELIFAHKTYDIDYALNLSATGWKITTLAGTTDYSIPAIMESYKNKMDVSNPENPMNKLIEKVWDNASN